MTYAMNCRIREVIEAKAQEAIDMGWIEDTINLCTFVGWMSEAMNCLGEEGLNDAWKEYNSDFALEYYCMKLKDNGAIADWDWDRSFQSVIIKKVEE